MLTDCEGKRGVKDNSKASGLGPRRMQLPLARMGEGQGEQVWGKASWNPLGPILLSLVRCWRQDSTF